MNNYIIRKEVTEESSLFILKNSHNDIITLNISLTENLTRVNHDIVAIELFPLEEGVRPRPDKELGKVIGKILGDYLEENPSSVLYFIPDNTDNRAEVRMRKFKSWYQEFYQTYNIYQEKIVEIDENGKPLENGLEFYLGCFYPKSLTEQDIENYVAAEILQKETLNK